MQRQRKKTAKANLQAVLDGVDDLRKLRYDSQESTNWLKNAQTAIEYAFNDKRKNFLFSKASRRVWVSSPGSEEERQLEYLSGLTEVQEFLESMLYEVDHFWDDDIVEQETVPTKASIGPDDKEVFVIHGRNPKVLESVKAFLQDLGLKPAILSEQPGKGRTIIEKFEDHAQVKYAVALLTPDDKALLNEPGSEKEELRARQNVIFEMGFFIGLLGRDRVAALLLGEIQIPSDYSGVEYIKLDQPTWKKKLYQELDAAGFKVKVDQSILDNCEGFTVDKLEKRNDKNQEISYDYQSDKINWNNVLHLVSQAYYLPEGETEFMTTSILDPTTPVMSYVEVLKQEGNPRDIHGNELPGVQYYLIVLDGIKPEYRDDLLARYNDAELIRWRLVVENNEIWETCIAVLSKTEKTRGNMAKVIFRIPEMEILIKDAM